ncbi:hypothetical protein QWY84_05945 [Aquisalimonas lutea]|uniref:hypothetical protein n=1 Tax=Aquisalimonas lutea TaxID=1327750 RepID=UPI0025B3E2B9|nr:hypothetical protein [Aquisalimonas lutea]MDN3517147.1 hypothetical protein [Aquisalimonas lutea]
MTDINITQYADGQRQADAEVMTNVAPLDTADTGDHSATHGQHGRATAISAGTGSAPAAGAPPCDLQEIDERLMALETHLAQESYDVSLCLDEIALLWQGLRRRRASYAYPLRDRLIGLTHILYVDDRLSFETLERCCGLSLSFISQGFRSLGLEARHCSEKTPEAGDPYRAYSVNPYALDDLSRPDVAYVLGFLWADARVLTRADGAPEGLRIVLHPRDRAMLEWLRDFFGSDAPIRPVSSRLSNGRTYGGLVLSVYSHRLAARLIALGYTHRRQGTGNVAPPAVPPSVEVDFWRGVCDGDGHIKRDKRYVFPLGGWELGICGSEALVTAFQAFAARTLRMATRVIRNGKSSVNFRVYVTGVRTPILAETLYPAGCTALARKYAIARDLTAARHAALAGGVRETQTPSRLLYTNVAAAPPAVYTILARYMPSTTAPDDDGDEPI